MITLLIIAIIMVTWLLSVLLAKGIVTFGGLIAKTPDMMDRHGDRKEPTDAPKRHAVLFAIGFNVLFWIGAGVLVASETTQELIVGGIIIFSSLLFSATVLGWSLSIYNLMKKNQRELKDSVVA